MIRVGIILAAVLCGCAADERANDIARIEAHQAKWQPLSHVWTQQMDGAMLAGVTDDKGYIVRGYRKDGKSYERLAVPDGCTISGMTAKGRTYLVHHVESERNIAVAELATGKQISVPDGFDCPFAMGMDVYLLKSISDKTWRVWRPLENKLEAWPYAFVQGLELLIGGVALVRSDKDASMHAFGFGLREFPDSQGVAGVNVLGEANKEVVILHGVDWNGLQKVYLPPKWDKPHILQQNERVIGVESNTVEIVCFSTGARRRIEMPTK